MKEPKIVNLDDASRAVAITVGGQTFNIERITLEMRQKYGEYTIFCGEYLDRLGKIQQGVASKEIETRKKPSAIVATLCKIFPRLRTRWMSEASSELSKLIESFAYGKAERVTGLLSLILEKNGHKFDLKWWESNSDYEKMESFIVAAITKDDESNAASKKKATVS